MNLSNISMGYIDDLEQRQDVRVDVDVPVPVPVPSCACPDCIQSLSCSLILHRREQIYITVALPRPFILPNIPSPFSSSHLFQSNSLHSLNLHSSILLLDIHLVFTTTTTHSLSPHHRLNRHSLSHIYPTNYEHQGCQDGRL